MLKELIRNEITSKELVKLGSDDLESVSREVIEGYWWCLSRLDDEVCSKYESLINEVINSLSKVRLSKALEVGVPEGSFDELLLLKLIDVVSTFYKAYFLGLVDAEGYVVVKVLRNFSLGNRVFREGSTTVLDVLSASFLKALGLVKLVSDSLVDDEARINTEL